MLSHHTRYAGEDARCRPGPATPGRHAPRQLLLMPSHAALCPLKADVTQQVRVRVRVRDRDRDRVRARARARDRARARA